MKKTEETTKTRKEGRKNVVSLTIRWVLVCRKPFQRTRNWDGGEDKDRREAENTLDGGRRTEDKKGGKSHGESQNRDLLEWGGHAGCQPQNLKSKQVQSSQRKWRGGGALLLTVPLDTVGSGLHATE